MAAGNVGLLRARLGLDAGPFNRGLKGAQGTAGRFSAQMKKMMAGVGVAIAGAFSVNAIKNSMATIDAQAKLAKSLGTTTTSMQVLARAGDLAGVSMQSIEQGTKDLYRRLSQAATGGGPAADALKRLGLSARDLLKLPLDQRLGTINQALKDFIPEAQRASVAGKLFGEEGSIALARLDPATIAQATEELKSFGFAISETDASKIEAANDSISKLGLIAQGLISQITVAIAPALNAMAQGFANVMREGGTLRTVIQTLGENIGRLAAYAATFAAYLAGQWVVAMGAAVLATGGLSRALLVLRGALIRSGIGILIVGAGELVYWFSRLVKGAGGFGNAMSALGSFVSSILDGLGRAALGLGEIMAGVAQGIGAAFVGAFSIIASRWDGMINLMAAPFNALMGALGASARIGASNIGGELAGVADAWLGQAAKRIGEGTSLIANSMNIVSPAAELLRRAVTSAGEDGATALDAAANSAKGLNDELESGAGGSGGGGGGGGAAGASLDTLKDKAGALKDKMSEVRDSMKSAFVGLVTGAKSLKDAVGELLGKFAEMLASTAFDALWGGLGGGGGGGWLGNVMDSMFGSIGKNANGTNNWRGGLTQIHERGGEIMNLPRGTQIIPHDISKRMADGGQNITYAPKIDARGADVGAVQRLEAALARAQAEFESRVINTVNVGRKRRTIA
ncbi:phage tail tape measure protein [Oceaniovalibus sp. ACAM 378]|uniref:phage tail tape measure protein n=1 Tax=Oceaniovalibus sp. ACAM 378 TaxID=2599923 RepID=UPI0011D78570|nr:phage tail tape measure protein [Oceaniovalibus sp. ACAM 378]TYB83970.1 phage tail tape measure protein [Oceaniovalibus sp. ACAM 378]